MTTPPVPPRLMFLPFCQYIRTEPWLPAEEALEPVTFDPQNPPAIVVEHVQRKGWKEIPFSVREPVIYEMHFLHIVTPGQFQFCRWVSREDMAIRPYDVTRPPRLLEKPISYYRLSGKLPLHPDFPRR